MTSRVGAVDTWFVRDVFALEPALMRLLRRSWRQPDDHADLRQEIYARLYETALRDGLPDSTPAFLFTCARNLIVDRARRAQVLSIETVAEIESLSDLPSDDFTPERVAAAREELRLLSQAIDGLPERCREVIALRKIEGLSQREIASRLGIADGTVEKQVTLGVRAIAEHLFSHGVDAAATWLRRTRTRGDA